LGFGAITAAIPFMKTFNKADDAFIQAAVDDSRRPELIKSTIRKQTIMLCCAVVISACALFMIFNAHNSGSAEIEFAVAAMTWMQVLKCESDLRLLMLVDKLKE